MRKLLLAAVLLAGGFLPGLAQASYVLDTGVPDNTGFPLSLDGTDFAAAEFNLGAGQSIGSIQGWITAGNSGAAGDTFTIALYAADGSGGLPGTQVWSGQATYTADGWNGLSNIGLSGLSAGNYWAAFEVGSTDSTAGLLLPTQANSGSILALAYAFSSGASYQAMSGEAFGVQVASAVPLPGTLLLLGSGLAALGGFRRRRQAA